MMKIAKIFDRDGKRLRPGDDIPDDLDKVTLSHYLRLGMIAEEVAQAEHKSESKPRRANGPSEKKPAGPQEKKPSGHSGNQEPPAPNETKPLDAGERASSQPDSDVVPDPATQAAAQEQASLSDQAQG